MPALWSDKKDVVCTAVWFGFLCAPFLIQIRSTEKWETLTVECHIKVELCGLFSVVVRTDVKSVLNK